MPQQPPTAVVMRDFPGLNLDSDPRDVEAGSARLQTNLECYTGFLTARRGIRLLRFESIVEVS